MALIDELKERREKRIGNWDARQGEIYEHQAALREIEGDIADLDRAIAALTPTPDFSAEQETAREQLEREPEIPEGFTVWNGGECPVDPAALVCVVTRSGALEQFHAGTFSNPDVLFDQWQWSSYRRQDDIIAYRVSLPAPAPVADEQDDASGFAESEAALPSMDDIIDPDLTGGLQTEEFLDRLHAGTLNEAPALNADMQDDREQPVQTEPEGYAPVTSPTIDDLIPEAMRQELEAEQRYAQPTNPDADERAKLNDWYDPQAVHERNRFNPWGIFKREPEEVS